MTQVDLRQYFKTDKIKGRSLNSPKDRMMCQKINEEMTVVRRRFDELSAKSITVSRRMVLRNGR